MEIKQIPESIAPTAVGPHGKYWSCDLAAMRKEAAKTDPMPETPDATISVWVIYAPWAHMLWHYYGIYLMHLRPIAKLGPPKIYLPNATHEFTLFAMSPDHVPDLLNPYKTHMRSINFAAQLIRTTDEEAIADLQKAVQDIIDGQLSPDTDFRRAWIARFGDNMVIA